MTKRRSGAVLLMLVWVFLSAGPFAYAATGKCCTQNMCPMKKSAHASSMACHDMMTQQSCHLRAGMCSHELDGLVFSFVAILPGAIVLVLGGVSRISRFDCKTPASTAIRKLIPPPKFSFA